MHYGVIKLRGKRRAKVVHYTNATTLEVFGRLVLKTVVREEGKEPSAEMIYEYCKEWLETLNENAGGETVYTISDVPLHAADNIVYSLDHYCKIDEAYKVTQLSSPEREIMYKAIVDRLESVIAKYSEVCTE